MYDFLLPAGIKDLINGIYFLAHLIVTKNPIKMKIKVLVPHLNSLSVYGFKPFEKGVKKCCENKIHVYFSYQKNYSVWGWS